jgi:hypothetical protein
LRVNFKVGTPDAYVQAGDAQGGEAVELVDVGHRIAIGVLPDLELGEHRVGRVDHAVGVGIDPAHASEALGRIGHGAVGEQLLAAIDDAVGVAVQPQQAFAPSLTSLPQSRADTSSPFWSLSRMPVTPVVNLSKSALIALKSMNGVEVVAMKQGPLALLACKEDRQDDRGDK